ncbi:type II toxin-antitoxin system VapC family toxin [Polaromonas sp. YR568]|uniref:type II toxin-antitoxin system VapC family toxin n=1 Tax=Polaromonas sp. YR568 TaxID=1855301 RepID=UPI003137A2F5
MSNVRFEIHAIPTAQVGIDSQCLSYAIDAFAGISTPKDSLASQRIALTRLFFYLPGTLWVTPTVTAECAQIRNIERADLHASFIRVLFGEIPLNSPHSITARASLLQKHHRGVNDCTIVAEAEDVGHTVLLTFDSDLGRHLAPHTSVRLLQPLEYWNLLAIPLGSKPDKVPHPTNPLASQDWWRW